MDIYRKQRSIKYIGIGGNAEDFEIHNGNEVRDIKNKNR